MAFLETSLGPLSWICGEQLNLGSSCIQRTILDVVNLFFLGVFCVSLVVGCIRKNHNSNNRREWISIVVSVCCALSSIQYLGAGLWYLVAEDDEFDHSSWLIYLVRGLVWFSLAVSLIATKSKWTRILSVIWWVSFSLSISVLNIKLLVGGLTIKLADLFPWPANILLLLCAFRNLRSLASNYRATDKSLYESLLSKKEERNRSRLGQASFFSRLTFSWINPLLTLGFSKPLELDDIPSLVRDDEANLAYQKFRQAWESISRDKSLNERKNLVIEALTKVYFKENILIGVCAMLRIIAVVVLPLWLYLFVNYSNLEERNLHRGLAIVGCLVLIKLVESLSQRHYFFLARQSGMRMRSGLMVAVYQKQLKLSCLGRRRHSTGEIVNYIAIDSYRMGEFTWWFHYSWSLVLQLILSVSSLFGVVGFGAITALAPLFICGFLNVPFARFLQNCQSHCMLAQDQRLRATSEILNNMKIIKLQSWEEHFKKLVESHRDEEFKWLAKAQMKKADGTFLYWLSPTIISSFIFFGCTIFGSAPLDASTIFTVLAALRSLAEPVRAIPEAISIMIQSKVSFDRINSFLLDEELKNDSVTMLPARVSGTSVTIQEGKFSWNANPTAPTIDDVNLDARAGEKTAICGPVGAGKSSLLYAILGEIPKISGTVNVYGKIAYVSQNSWIQSGTVRDNILFGNPMDQAKYDNAVRSCALDKDISNFQHGDLTEIGQRGLNMSGGQRQRLQLARAVYNDADIYLLDDPFSAVDAHTAATLFNDCVMGALGKKTVILVTHQVEFLSAVDRILIMEGGQITQAGAYQEILSAGTAFEQLVNAHRDSMASLDPSRNEIQEESCNADMARSDGAPAGYPSKQECNEEEISNKGESTVQLTAEEEKEIGDIGLKPFLDYIHVSKGQLFLCLGVLSQTLFVALQAASTYWLAYAIERPQINNGILIGIYTLISTSCAVFVYFRSFFIAKLGLKASQSFFSGFTDAIFKAPMLFFDSTPVGRVLTRASSDLSVLDFDIPFVFSFVMSPLIELVAIIGIMVSVTWQVLIVAIFSMIASKYVQGYYLASARQMTRINGTTKAPVMNYASETALGVVTIRAFGMVDRFFENFLKVVNKDALLFFHVNAATEWLIIRIEALHNLTLFTAAFLLILLPKGYVPSGLVGLSLSYALSLTGTQVFMTRWYCNFSNYIISAERIKQFMHIPPEPPAIVEENRPPHSWPSKGRIDLQELKIKYRPNAPLVLKGISCTFKEGSRVGVVGRTGSGKTTLISALFRLVEPASGTILVDGLDICSIGLKDLRMKLSVIPQEPTLFKGSVRTNLDPLGFHSDQEIWEALDKCQLKTTINSLPNLLDSSVSDEGENWSAGQRQLFCLGRVLLRRNRILVLDEATASIDSATDAILQRIIRQEFRGSTVITVAHRVPTVVDSDMVMVLSYGKLVEYEEPTELMEINSSFSKLVAEYWSSCRNGSY